MFESSSAAQPKKKVRKWKCGRKLLDSDSYEEEEADFSGLSIKRENIVKAKVLKNISEFDSNKGRFPTAVKVKVLKKSESESIKDNF